VILVLVCGIGPARSECTSYFSSDSHVFPPVRGEAGGGLVVLETSGVLHQWGLRGVAHHLRRGPSAKTAIASTTTSERCCRCTDTGTHTAHRSWCGRGRRRWGINAHSIRAERVATRTTEEVDEDSGDETNRDKASDDAACNGANVGFL